MSDKKIQSSHSRKGQPCCLTIVTTNGTQDHHYKSLYKLACELGTQVNKLQQVIAGGSSPKLEQVLKAKNPTMVSYHLGVDKDPIPEEPSTKPLERYYCLECHKSYRIPTDPHSELITDQNGYYILRFKADEPPPKTKPEPKPEDEPKVNKHYIWHCPVCDHDYILSSKHSHLMTRKHQLAILQKGGSEAPLPASGPQPSKVTQSPEDDQDSEEDEEGEEGEEGEGDEELLDIDL